MAAHSRSAPSLFGSILSSRTASFFRFLRSTSKSSLRFARCTLTATSRPSFRVARCTCPSDAAASGSSEKEEKISSIGLPSSLATISLARDPENPGTSSWRDLRALTNSGLSTSVRVEMTCPSLTNVGPRRRRPSRTNSAAATFFSVSPLLFALSTLITLRSAKPQTSTFRLKDERAPRCSHPFSRTSPRTWLLSSIAGSRRQKRNDRFFFCCWRPASLSSFASASSIFSSARSAAMASGVVRGEGMLDWVPFFGGCDSQSGRSFSSFPGFSIGPSTSSTEVVVAGRATLGILGARVGPAPKSRIDW
mmetsp:Transcript_2744/g.11287  ORF Transcript_2744/g.11287 Transcript_2744/m.11287 type:complete len:307 (+) Transcript_2744:2173-3093(+)